MSDDEIIKIINNFLENYKKNNITNDYKFMDYISNNFNLNEYINKLLLLIK
jgi:hypothetical protein